MQQLGREPAGRQRAGTVTLREDVRRADQLAQSFGIAGRAQIELGRELAVPGIRLLIAHMGQMRRGDFEHLRAMLGKSPAADRTGKQAYQIENANACQGRLLAGSGSGGLSPMRTISRTGSAAMA